jgi:hypothetical protein
VGHGPSMTSRRNVSPFRWRALRAIGLCGAFAFVISIASPVDDDLQQECVGGRTREHAARLLKLSHPNTAAGRILPAKAPPVACKQRQLSGAPTGLAFDLLQLPGAAFSRQTGDRSPPLAPL